MCERATIFQYITVYEEVPYSVKDGIKLNAGKGLDNGKKQGCFYSWEYNYCQYFEKHGLSSSRPGSSNDG